MNKSIDDSMSLPTTRSHNRRRFSIRRFFCRRPSTRFALSFVGTGIADRNKTDDNDGSLQSMAGVSLNTVAAISNVASKSDNSSTNYYANEGDHEGHECTLCYIHQPSYEFPRVSSCSHRFCVTCLKQYITIELTESRVLVTCPACNEMYHPSTIANILDNKELVDKYENFMLRRVLVIDPDTRWCPAPDCGYAVIASGCAVCPKLECEKPGCGTSFCYHCKQLWHPNQTCDSARKDKHDITDSYSQNSQGELKACPRCSQFIMKLNDGSCNHMVCAICGLEFCWLCMKEINDLHYLSPSGCTFWGRKPWTRKKKTLAQLGTLVGAPVVIALLSTIAVPAIIIYSPIWVGKKILQQRFKSKSKRKLVTAVGVSSTIILSPLLAAITVGVGVPLLFGYVYIVVPLSMCKDCRPEQANYNSDNSYELATVEEKPIVEQQEKAMSIADSMGAIKNKTQDNNGDNRRCSSVDSVGIMETASTKALAGSIYMRDRDSIGNHDNISFISQTTVDKMRSPQKLMDNTSEVQSVTNV